MTIEFDGQNNKLGTTTADSVTIKTNDTDALTVDSSQNVGVGGTSTVGGGATNSQILFSIPNTNRALTIKTVSDGAEFDVGTTNTNLGKDLIFSSGGTEVARFTSAGLAIGGTGSANALDDYEEGTFDPDLTFGGGNTGLTYSQRRGDYTKIGQAVFFTIKISLTNKGTSTGDAVISLPFSVKNTASWTGFEFVATNFCLQNCTVAHTDGVAVCSDLAGGLIITAGQNSSVELTNTAFNNGSNFRITGSFLTDD